MLADALIVKPTVGGKTQDFFMGIFKSKYSNIILQEIIELSRIILQCTNQIALNTSENPDAICQRP